MSKDFTKCPAICEELMWFNTYGRISVGYFFGTLEQVRHTNVFGELDNTFISPDDVLAEK